MKQSILGLLTGVLLTGVGCFTPTPDHPLTLEVCPGHKDAKESFVRYQAYLGAIETLLSLNWRITESDPSQFTLKAKRCDEYDRAACYGIAATSQENGTISFFIPERVDRVHLPSHWIELINRNYKTISCDLIEILETKIRGKGLEDALLKKPEDDKKDQFGFESDTSESPNEESPEEVNSADDETSSEDL